MITQERRGYGDEKGRVSTQYYGGARAALDSLVTNRRDRPDGQGAV